MVHLPAAPDFRNTLLAVAGFFWWHALSCCCFLISFIGCVGFDALSFVLPLCQPSFVTQVPDCVASRPHVRRSRRSIATLIAGWCPRLQHVGAAASFHLIPYHRVLCLVLLLLLLLLLFVYLLCSCGAPYIMYCESMYIGYCWRTCCSYTLRLTLLLSTDAQAQHMQYAVLNFASLHAHFGHATEALQVCCFHSITLHTFPFVCR